MPRYYSDIPSHKDLLGRFPFAREIAHSLIFGFKSGNDSIVIGINGKWGCGKSTLLKFIREEIKKETKEEECIVFEFNPWLFSGQKELQTIFLDQLLEKMHDLERQVQKKSKKWKSMADIFMPLLRILLKIGPITKFVHSGIGEMIVDFEKFISAFDKNKPLDKIKDKVDQKIQKNKIRFYIFIDDIERLTPQETTEVFQLIKLNANFKNTVYIIAYDHEIVQESLMLQYKEVGRKYLDKIVQVDYKVPEIFNEVLEDIFFEKLQFFLEENAINYDTKYFFKIWQYNDFKGYFNTLRDVYRYINSLQMRLPAIHEEIDISDFMILEAIRLFDNYSYEEIYKAYKVSLIKKHSIQRVLMENRAFQEKSNPFSRSLIKSLFTFNADNTLKSNGNKGVSDLRYFERYFSLSLSSMDVIGDIFNEFMYNDNKREELLLRVFTGEKTSNFIRRLLNAPTSVTSHDLQKIILEIIHFSANHYDSISMEKYADQIFDLIDTLSMKLPDKTKSYRNLFNELLSQKYYNNLYVAFLLGKYYEKMNDLLQGNYPTGMEDDVDMAEDKLETIELEYYQRIEEAFQKGVKEVVRRRLVGDTVSEKNKFFDKFFMIKYAEFFPNGYYNYIKNLITSQEQEKLIDILSYSFEFNKISFEPISINTDRLLLVIPNKSLFKEILSVVFIDGEKEDIQSNMVQFIKRNLPNLHLAYSPSSV